MSKYLQTDAGKSVQARYAKSQLGRENRSRYEKTDKGRAAIARRTYNRQARVPKWANMKEIDDFYLLRPPGFELDHIIPIRGKTVSGLHVLENLQFIPAPINRAKSNKVIPETLEAAICPLHY